MGDMENSCFQMYLQYIWDLNTVINSLYFTVKYSTKTKHLLVYGMIRGREKTLYFPLFTEKHRAKTSQHLSQWEFCHRIKWDQNKEDQATTWNLEHKKPPKQRISVRIIIYWVINKVLQASEYSIETCIDISSITEMESTLGWNITAIITAPAMLHSHLETWKVMSYLTES